ncbi:hypothetical protein EON66_01285, partial [archaeon]
MQEPDVDAHVLARALPLTAHRIADAVFPRSTFVRSVRSVSTHRAAGLSCMPQRSWCVMVGAMLFAAMVSSGQLVEAAARDKAALDEGHGEETARTPFSLHTMLGKYPFVHAAHALARMHSRASAAPDQVTGTRNAPASSLHCDQVACATSALGCDNDEVALRQFVERLLVSHMVPDAHAWQSSLLARVASLLSSLPAPAERSVACLDSYAHQFMRAVAELSPELETQVRDGLVHEVYAHTATRVAEVARASPSPANDQLPVQQATDAVRPLEIIRDAPVNDARTVLEAATSEARRLNGEALRAHQQLVLKSMPTMPPHALNSVTASEHDERMLPLAAAKRGSVGASKQGSGKRGLVGGEEYATDAVVIPGFIPRVPLPRMPSAYDDAPMAVGHGGHPGKRASAGSAEQSGNRVLSDSGKPTTAIPTIPSPLVTGVLGQLWTSWLVQTVLVIIGVVVAVYSNALWSRFATPTAPGGSQGMASSAGAGSTLPGPTLHRKAPSASSSAASTAAATSDSAGVLSGAGSAGVDGAFPAATSTGTSHGANYATRGDPAALRDAGAAHGVSVSVAEASTGGTIVRSASKKEKGKGSKRQIARTTRTNAVDAAPAAATSPSSAACAASLDVCTPRIGEGVDALAASESQHISCVKSSTTMDAVMVPASVALVVMPAAASGSDSDADVHARAPLPLQSHASAHAGHGGQAERVPPTEQPGDDGGGEWIPVHRPRKNSSGGSNRKAGTSGAATSEPPGKSALLSGECAAPVVGAVAVRVPSSKAAAPAPPVPTLAHAPAISAPSSADVPVTVARTALPTTADLASLSLQPSLVAFPVPLPLPAPAFVTHSVREAADTTPSQPASVLMAGVHTGDPLLPATVVAPACSMEAAARASVSAAKRAAVPMPVQSNGSMRVKSETGAGDTVGMAVVA